MLPSWPYFCPPFPTPPATPSGVDAQSPGKSHEPGLFYHQDLLSKLGNDSSRPHTPHSGLRGSWAWGAAPGALLTVLCTLRWQLQAKRNPGFRGSVLQTLLRPIFLNVLITGLFERSFGIFIRCYGKNPNWLFGQSSPSSLVHMCSERAAAFHFIAGGRFAETQPCGLRDWLSMSSQLGRPLGCGLWWAPPTSPCKRQGTVPPLEGLGGQSLLAMSQLPMSRELLSTAARHECEMPRHWYIIRGQHSKITPIIQMWNQDDKTTGAARPHINSLHSRGHRLGL